MSLNNNNVNGLNNQYSITNASLFLNSRAINIDNNNNKNNIYLHQQSPTATDAINPNSF